MIPEQTPGQKMHIKWTENEKNCTFHHSLNYRIMIESQIRDHTSQHLTVTQRIAVQINNFIWKPWHLGLKVTLVFKGGIVDPRT